MGDAIGSDRKFPSAPNLLDRGFTAEKPNQKGAGDISCVWPRKCWLFLAVILDPYARRAIGRAVSRQAAMALFEYTNGF